MPGEELTARSASESYKCLRRELCELSPRDEEEVTGEKMRQVSEGSSPSREWHRQRPSRRMWGRTRNEAIRPDWQGHIILVLVGQRCSICRGWGAPEGVSAEQEMIGFAFREHFSGCRM